MLLIGLVGVSTNHQTCDFLGCVLPYSCDSHFTHPHTFRSQLTSRTYFPHNVAQEFALRELVTKVLNGLELYEFATAAILFEIILAFGSEELITPTPSSKFRELLRIVKGVFEEPRKIDWTMKAYQERGVNEG